MNKKRILAMIMTIVICLSMIPAAYAAGGVATTVTAVYDPAATKVTISGTASSSQVSYYIPVEGKAPVYNFVNVVAGAFSITLPWTKPLAEYTVTITNVDDDTTAVTTFSTLNNELQDAKNEATTAVTDAFEAYDETVYTTENWSALKAIKDTALTAITAATTVEAVTPIADKAISDMDAVLTIAEQDEHVLQDAKDDATTAVNDAFDAYIAENYSAEFYSEIVNIKDSALEAIVAATSTEEVESIQSDAIDYMSYVPTLENELHQIAALDSFNIAGSSVVGTIPVGSGDINYLPTINVNIPATTTAITAANLVAANEGTVELFATSSFTDPIASQAIDSNSTTVFASVTSYDEMTTKYYKIVLNVVDAATKYKITAPTTFTKVGSLYKANVSIDRVKAAKLADPKFYVVYTFANGSQSFNTTPLSLSDTSSTQEVVVSADVKSVLIAVVDGNVDWSVGSPIFKSNFTEIAQ